MYSCTVLCILLLLGNQQLYTKSGAYKPLWGAHKLQTKWISKTVAMCSNGLHVATYAHPPLYLLPQIEGTNSSSGRGTRSHSRRVTLSLLLCHYCLAICMPQDPRRENRAACQHSHPSNCLPTVQRTKSGVLTENWAVASGRNWPNSDSKSSWFWNSLETCKTIDEWGTR